MKRPFGFELLVDLYDCRPTSVGDLRLCYDFLEDAVKTLGVNKQSPPFIFESPLVGPNGENWESKAGLSGWIPLIESGISIHTLVPRRFISVDYYTCSIIDNRMEQKLIDLAKLYFQPEEVEKRLIKRGLKYYEDRFDPYKKH